MPHISEYTPVWLSQPNPGYDLFTPAAKAPNYPSLSQNGHGKKAAKPGPLRTIAKRGTEVFIGVGKEIRWADLVYLKEAYEDGQKRSKETSRTGGRETSQYEDDHAQGYRTIKTPVADDIRQLIISPNESLLAILTSHTVHIAVLPDPSHLTAADKGPLRLKTFQLGPTSHVTTQSGIASALWHPLGVNGSCLVTVTEEAVVRVWELSKADRRSFDKSTLAIDLKKLADGTSTEQDFGASVSGRNTGFSPDSFDMEVAAACFSNRVSGGWSPMTLWIAMKQGDIYALCPLLPSKWSPPPALIPSLSVSIVAKNATIEDDIEVSEHAKQLVQQQLLWMSELDNQEPLLVESPFSDSSTEVYTRPSKPGHVPKLQGPFELDLPVTDEEEDESDVLLTDIYTIGPKLDGEELMLGEEEDLEVEDEQDNGLSLAVICLLSRNGRLTVCLDLDGIEAQWLPSSKSRTPRFAKHVEPPSLLTFDVLDTVKKDEYSEDNWPVFSEDFNSRYMFYVTDAFRITYVSLFWVFRLEEELKGANHGSEFRIENLARGDKSFRQRVYTQKLSDQSSPFTASALIRDPDLGHFLLTATPTAPVALKFDDPQVEIGFRRSRSQTYSSEPEEPLVFHVPRPVYQPPQTFKAASALQPLKEKLEHSKYKRLLKEEVRLSPATLSIMNDAHAVLSDETHRLGSAAAELFRRCQQLQDELRSQIQKANEVAKMVDKVTGDDCDVLPEDDGPSQGANKVIELRIRKAQETQASITARLEKVRKSMSKGPPRELSNKEKDWAKQVDDYASKLLGSESLHVNSATDRQPWQRFEEVQTLTDELVGRAKDLLEAEETAGSGVEEGANIQVPSEIRKAKLSQIMALLERETALVEGAKSRLERLRLD
ncbi:hypothetical protein B0O99DRAFT_523519 [Bisporella sp. PMI_857]|nr:hypothetical protein B0O99DRAFT_523519 [Bisporella sp. PMI_857]